MCNLTNLYSLSMGPLSKQHSMGPLSKQHQGVVAITAEFFK